MLKSFVIIMSASCAALLLAAIFHVRINTSHSMPIGFYREIDKQVVRGDLVEVCLPQTLARTGLVRGYIAGGGCSSGSEPVVKEIVAVAGDEVILQKDAMIINGKPLSNSKTLALDEKGRAIPAVARKPYILQQNEVWLYGYNDIRSWDSRYYGAIDKHHIVSVLKSELVFRLKSGSS
jgi:conjugative transfer signal peptidase TraF